MFPQQLIPQNMKAIWHIIFTTVSLAENSALYLVNAP